MIRWRRNRGLARLTLPLGWEIAFCRRQALGPDLESSAGIRFAGEPVGRIWSVSVYGPGRRYGSVELELHGRQS